MFNFVKRTLLKIFVVFMCVIGMMSGKTMVPVNAEEGSSTPSITINKPSSEPSDTSGTKATSYEYFQIFKATFGSNDAMAYYIPSSDEALKTALDTISVDVDGTSTDAFTFSQAGDRWNVKFNIDNVENNSTFAKELASAIKNVITSDNALSYGTFTRNGDSATSGTVDAGYYLVTSSLGSALVLDTLKPVTINEKNEIPTFTKTQSRNQYDGYTTDVISQQVSCDVYYRLEISIPATATKEIKVTDIMNRALGMRISSNVTAYLGNDRITDVSLSYPDLNSTWNEDYEYLYNSANTAKNHKFTMTIPATIVQKLAAKATADTPVTLRIQYSGLTYKEMITDDAINKAYIEYDNITLPEQTVIAKTYSIKVHKYGDNDTSGYLKNAVFELWTNDKADPQVDLIKEDDHTYHVMDSSGVSATKGSYLDSDGNIQEVAVGNRTPNFITVDTDDIVIKGLDADAKYYLKEVKAPDGYNRISSNIYFDMTKTDETVVNIQNKSGTVLPSTGGIGATIFYIAGGAIIIVAIGILLVRRKSDA